MKLALFSDTNITETLKHLENFLSFPLKVRLRGFYSSAFCTAESFVLQKK